MSTCCEQSRNAVKLTPLELSRMTIGLFLWRDFLTQIIMNTLFSFLKEYKDAFGLLRTGIRDGEVRISHHESICTCSCGGLLFECRRKLMEVDGDC